MAEQPGATLTATGDLSDTALQTLKVIDDKSVPMVHLGAHYTGDLQLTMTLAGICPYFSAHDLQNWKQADLRSITEKALNAL